MIRAPVTKALAEAPVARPDVVGVMQCGADLALAARPRRRRRDAASPPLAPARRFAAPAGTRTLATLRLRDRLVDDTPASPMFGEAGVAGARVVKRVERAAGEALEARNVHTARPCPQPATPAGAGGGVDVRVAGRSIGMMVDRSGVSPAAAPSPAAVAAVPAATSAGNAD